MAFARFVDSLVDTPPITLAIYGGAALASAFAAWEAWSYWRLSHVPGPKSMALSIYPMNKLALSGKMSFELQKLQKKYGKCSWLVTFF